MLTHYDPAEAYAKLKKDDLKRPTKLMGNYSAEDRGMVDWGILPNCFVNTHCTNTVIYRITPLSATECEFSQTWLVHEDAVEGVDYEVEGLVWLDRVTLSQDEAIVRNTQAGVGSRYYEPGPYAELEEPILQVHKDYVRLLRYGRGLLDRS
jgi:Rieske 2Fe-2S family protein